MVKSMMMATQSKVFWGADLRGDNFIEVLIHFFISIANCYKPISFV